MAFPSVWVSGEISIAHEMTTARQVEDAVRAVDGMLGHEPLSDWLAQLLQWLGEAEARSDQDVRAGLKG